MWKCDNMWIMTLPFNQGHNEYYSTMKSLKEYISEAETKKVAIGHFNISDMVGFWAVVEASKKMNLPVIIGVSEGERDFLCIKQIKALVDTIKEEGLPVFLNADHTYSLEKVKTVVDAGFDAVIIDGANRDIENLDITKSAVDYIKNTNSNVLIEGELGFIGQSSKVLDEIPHNISKISPTEAKHFVENTKIDLFAPAVGNVHGVVKGGEPKLDIELIKEIKKLVSVPLVLHGASGNSDEEIKNAIEAGISIIHINTEIRLSYRESLSKTLIENPKEIAPYKFLQPSLLAMQKVIEDKLILFNNL